MKRIFALLSAFVFAVAAYAQTAEEIIARMDAAMDQVEKDSGFRMTMDLKIPLLGTTSARKEPRAMKVAFGKTRRPGCQVFWTKRRRR